MGTKVDLSGPAAGQLGDGLWFSELFWLSVRAQFTGGFLVRSDRGDAAFFFRNGNPVHAAGAAYGVAYLGELLQREGAVAQSQLTEALELQSAAPEGAKPLLGALLCEGGTDPIAVKRALERQVEQRAMYLFQLKAGEWKAAPGENSRIRELGVEAEGWPILLRALASGTLEEETRALTESLLGKAVKLRGKMPVFPGLELNDEQKHLAHYLEKPRKPDQLERALNRKTVRAMLRLLILEEALEVVPASQGIPIPKATLLKGQGSFTPLPPEPEAPLSPASTGDRVAAAPSTSAKIDPQLKRDIEELHASMNERSHFEVLGANEKTEAADLRKLFTVVAKKYHPDAFPPTTNEDLAHKVREISARLNEAYNTLSNDVARAQYLKLWADERIKGDAKKAERIRDAGTKFKMAQVLLKKREYKKARELFKYSIDNDPSSGEYRAYYAWSIYADPTIERSEAIPKAYALLLEALKSADKNAQIHFYAGSVLKAQDKHREALHHFKEAVKLDRKHTDAEREVRLLESREKKTDKDDKPSGLSRFFKR